MTLGGHTMTTERYGRAARRQPQLLSRMDTLKRDRRVLGAPKWRSSLNVASARALPPSSLPRPGTSRIQGSPPYREFLLKREALHRM